MNRILLIDDEEAICQSLSALLTREGFDVQRYVYPQELFKQEDWRDAQAVVSDINMPDMDGIELGLKLRKSGFRGPILFITGMGNIKIEQYRKALEPIHLLNKPFRTKDLSEAIRAAIEPARS